MSLYQVIYIQKKEKKQYGPNNFCHVFLKKYLNNQLIWL